MRLAQGPHAADLFTLKNNEAFRQLIFGNSFIKNVDDHIHFDINFSSNSQWHRYIENFEYTAAKSLGIMRKHKYT